MSSKVQIDAMSKANTPQRSAKIASKKKPYASPQGLQAGDLSTEDRIKTAARTIFTRKGFAATRTRDIAEEAGINLALLNYYFRSKEKLFDIIMMENFEQVITGALTLLDERNTTLEEKIEKIVGFYFQQLTSNPDLPIFVINEIRNNPERLRALGPGQGIIQKSYFLQQIKERLGGNHRPSLNPLHIIINLLSMTVFPFIARPLFEEFAGLTEQGFSQLIEERRRLIPLWIKNIIDFSK